MNYTADTWFFVQLIEEKKEKAKSIWTEIKEGKGRLIVPTVVIVEMSKRLLKKNLGEELNDFLMGLEKSEKIFVVELTSKIAAMAGKLGNSYDLKIADSVILATAIYTDYTNIITDDEHFTMPAKHGKIRVVRF